MGKNKNYYIRKAHRYLGILLGVQFLFWTVGGLYFSWNDIDKVHGDHLRKEKKYFSASLSLASPQTVLEKLQATAQVDSLHSVQLIEVLGVPTYQVRYFTADAANHDAHESDSHGAGHTGGKTIKTQLANAETGQLLSPLNKDQAIAIAKNNVVGTPTIEQVEYLTAVGSHHEYRKKPLPAWAVTFGDQADCTVYISADLGTFQSIRHNQWRVFDFLWMLHTMDYEGRDNFGNILLKVFSVFGLFTVLSGFMIYYVSSPSVRKIKKKINA